MARPGLAVHRKFKRLARRMDTLLPGMGAVLARGLLETLWDAAYEAGEDYIGDAEAVEAQAGWTGESGILAQALLDAGGDGLPGFIEHDPERPGFRIHDLFENAPDYVQKRMLREIARRQRGQSISDLRREAGRKGREAQLARQAAASGGQLPANGGQAADVCGQTSGKRPANGGTPAPAPAPALKDLSPSRAREPGDVRGTTTGQETSGAQTPAPSKAPAADAAPAPVPPQHRRCNRMLLGEAWFNVTGLTHTDGLRDLAEAVDTAAARQVPPADPDDYAERAMRAFVAWVDGIRNPTRRPQKTPRKLLEHFARMEEILAGQRDAVPEDTEDQQHGVVHRDLKPEDQDAAVGDSRGFVEGMKARRAAAVPPPRRGAG